MDDEDVEYLIAFTLPLFENKIVNFTGDIIVKDNEVLFNGTTTDVEIVTNPAEFRTIGIIKRIEKREDTDDNKWLKITTLLPI